MKFRVLITTVLLLLVALTGCDCTTRKSRSPKSNYDIPSAGTWYEIQPDGYESPMGSKIVFPLWITLYGPNVYLYGTSFNKSQQTDQKMFIYNHLSNTWTSIPIEDTLEYLYDIPSARMMPAVWMTDSTKFTMAGGGIFTDHSLTDVTLMYRDVWEFDTVNLLWRRLNLIGDSFPQSGFMGASAVGINSENAYIFGGMTKVLKKDEKGNPLSEYTFEDSNVLYLHRIKEGALVEIKPPTLLNNNNNDGDGEQAETNEEEGSIEWPLPRHGAYIYKTSLGFTIMGGYSHSLGYLNDIWNFDMLSKTWKRIIPYPNTLSVSPTGGLYGSSGSMVGSKFIGYGGYNKLTGYTNTKTLIYDTKKGSWEIGKTVGNPYPVIGGGVTGNYQSLFLFGGFTQVNVRRMGGDEDSGEEGAGVVINTQNKMPIYFDEHLWKFKLNQDQ